MEALILHFEFNHQWLANNSLWTKSEPPAIEFSPMMKELVFFLQHIFRFFDKFTVNTKHHANPSKGICLHRKYTICYTINMCCCNSVSPDLSCDSDLRLQI